MHSFRVDTRTDWESSEVGERLRWAMDRVHVGVRELGVSSKLTGGLVSKLAKRREVIAGNADTMFKLARALDVSPAWLAFGLGQPLDEDRPSRPNRDRAARICREAGVSEDAIRSVLDEITVASEDPPVLAWIDRIRLRDAELRSVRASRSL